MKRATKRRSGAEASGIRELPVFAAAFAFAVAAVLGALGMNTSGFTFALTPRQLLPLIALVFVAYLLIGLASLVPILLNRSGHRAEHRASARLGFAMTAVTVWFFLTLTFLPVKGSETFVRAGTLTTFQLNMLGLAGVFVAGLLAGWLISFLIVRVLGVLRAILTRGGVRVLGLALAALSVAVLLAGPSLRSKNLRSLSLPDDRPWSDRPRVAVIGVDGCDWEMLAPLVDAGELPNFARLIERGSYGPLLSMEPMISPRIWTTIATGELPEEHGVIGFVNDAGVPVNATMRRVPAVWEIVSAYGGVSAVNGWYVTWPADEIRGYMVSDRVHSLLRGVTQIWHSIEGRPTNERLQSFGWFIFDAEYKRYGKDERRYQQNRIIDEPLRWGYLRDAIYGRLAHELIPRYEPDFTAVYFRGVDFVQHFFWQYTDRSSFPGVTDDEAHAYGEVIGNYYRYQDRLLGRLLDDLGSDVNVLLVSDHGFTARVTLDPSMPELTGRHDLRGVIIASGPAFAPLGHVEGATILDIAPTCLAVLGLPATDSMHGRPLAELLSASHLERYPLVRVSDYGARLARTGQGDVGSTMDESIKEQLRSLGYIQ
ncbi:alkaline phosphatase family protein [bacterium]|nr:alkaline phosphatase family protein [bacterium]